MFITPSYVCMIRSYTCSSPHHMKNLVSIIVPSCPSSPPSSLPPPQESSGYAVLNNQHSLQVISCTSLSQSDVNYSQLNQVSLTLSISYLTRSALRSLFLFPCKLFDNFKNVSCFFTIIHVTIIYLPNALGYQLPVFHTSI